MGFVGSAFSSIGPTITANNRIRTINVMPAIFDAE
jgi:hypothetical protein